MVSFLYQEINIEESQVQLIQIHALRYKIGMTLRAFKDGKVASLGIDQGKCFLPIWAYGNSNHVTGDQG